MTPVIARTFERTVYQTFNKNNLEGYLNDSQFAYRTGASSCVNAMLKMQRIFLAALDKNDTSLRHAQLECLLWISQKHSTM